MNHRQHKQFILNRLNLEPIVIKAMDNEEGYAWSFEDALAISGEYRKFLVLCLQNPEDAIVPSTQVDDFWHLHILDTQKYAEDCQQCFGYFLHHFPYFGMRGDQDAQNLARAWAQTKDLYVKEFGELPAGLWLSSKRCPNCGRRINDCDTFNQQRPSFADYRLNA